MTDSRKKEIEDLRQILSQSFFDVLIQINNKERSEILRAVKNYAKKQEHPTDK